MENKFRKFTTLSGKLVLAGKNAEQNEQLVRQAGSDEFMLHTKAAGSPFCNIKAAEGVSKEDIKEAALFCATYSREWKHYHKDVEVHVFKGKDLYKEKSMKTGTFGVKKFKVTLVKNKDIEKFIGNKE